MRGQIEYIVLSSCTKYFEVQSKHGLIGVLFKEVLYKNNHVNLTI